MKKIKELIQKSGVEFKESFSNYRFTYIITFLTFFVLLIAQDNEPIEEMFLGRVTEQVIFFYMPCVALVWLLEILNLKLWKRIIGNVIACGVGVFFSYFTVTKDMGEDWGYRFLIGYVVILMSLNIFFINKKLNVGVAKYILDSFQNLLSANTLFVSIWIGVLAVTAIFVELILELSSDVLISKVMIILVGYIFMPLNIMALTKKKAHISLFIRNLVKYVLYPITLVAMGIIYLYIIKIIIVREITSSSVYAILAGIFVVGFPIYMMVMNYRDDNKFYKVSCKIVPYAFIPFIGLQIHAIARRIMDVGLTGTRYLAIMLIILEVTIILAAMYKKKDVMEYNCIVIALLAFIITMSPFNYETMSAKSQASIMLDYWNAETGYSELTVSDKKRVAGAYEYLVLNKYADEFMSDEITQEALDEIADYAELARLRVDETSKRYSMNYTEDDTIDIEDYKKIKLINSASLMDSDIKEYEKIIAELLEKHGQKFEENYKDDRIVKYDKNKELVFTSIDVSYAYNEEKKVIIEYCDFEAIELIK